MRRIPILFMLMRFAVAMAVALAIGTAVRVGDIVITRNTQREVANDIRRLRAAEGRADTGTNEERAYASTMRELLRDKAGMDFRQIYDTAAHIRDVPEASLSIIDPESRWRQWRAIATSPVHEAFHELDERHSLTAIMRGERPAPDIAMPPDVPFWNRTFWLLFYLLGCVGFVAWYAISAVVERELHPVSDTRWGRFPVLLMVAAAAPATVPTLTVYGLVYLFRADIDWKGVWRRLAQAARNVGYHLHILRRLPAPVVQSVQFEGLQLTPRQEPPVPTTPVAEAVPLQTEAVPPNDEKEEPRNDWCVLRTEEILGREHLLVAVGIEVYPITIGHPEAIDGYGVEPGRVEKLIEILELGNAEREDHETDIQGTTYVSFSGEAGEISLDGIEEAHADRVRAALEAVSMNTDGVNIEFRDERGRMAAPIEVEDGAIVVFYNSAPAHNGQWTTFKTLYGLEIPKGCSAVVSTSDRRLVKDDDGNAVAQVVGRCVYILANLLQVPAKLMSRLLARTLYDAVKLVKAGPETDDEMRDVWRAGLAKHRDGYVDLCIERIARRQKELEREIAGCDRDIVNASKTITQSVRNKRAAEKSLDGIINGERRAEIERLQKEFEQLAGAQPVVAVRTYPERIEVDTRTVYVRHAGKRYEIGRFRITMGTDGAVTMVNLTNTNREDSHAHPHVMGGGHACLGNVAEPLAKLIGEREYATAVNLVFRFLESYNPSNPYRRIEHWKEVSA